MRQSRDPPGPKGDDLPLSTQHLFDIKLEVRSITMTPVGTNTDMIKKPETTELAGRNGGIWALLGYSCCISRACPLHPAPFLQPGTLDSLSGGDQQMASWNGRNQVGKPNLCSKMLM